MSVSSGPALRWQVAEQLDDVIRAVHVERFGAGGQLGDKCSCRIKALRWRAWAALNGVCVPVKGTR